MNHDHTPRAQLSALLDGALDADRLRFLLRRLQHDGELADTLARWQLAADALRGAACAPAPSGFVEAVAARVAGEAPPQPASALPPALPPASADASRVEPRASRLGWFSGGALAASVAIALLVGLRPGQVPVPPAVQVAQAPPMPMPSAAPAPPRLVGEVDAAAPAARVSLAASLPEKPTGRTLASRSRVRQVASAASTPTPAAEPVSQPVVAAAESATDPFRQPPAQAWPRAHLPTGASQGAFNVRFGGDAAADPFQPRAESRQVADPPIANGNP